MSWSNLGTALGHYWLFGDPHVCSCFSFKQWKQKNVPFLKSSAKLPSKGRQQKLKLQDGTRGKYHRGAENEEPLTQKDGERNCSPTLVLCEGSLHRVFQKLRHLDGRKYIFML